MSHDVKASLSCRKQDNPFSKHEKSGAIRVYLIKAQIVLKSICVLERFFFSFLKHAKILRTMSDGKEREINREGERERARDVPLLYLFNY